MSNKQYLAKAHYITKAMSDVEYPISKKELIDIVGHKEIKVGWNETKSLKQLIEPIKIDNFDSAAVFFNALHAVS